MVYEDLNPVVYQGQTWKNSVALVYQTGTEFISFIVFLLYLLFTIIATGVVNLVGVMWVSL